MSFVAIQGAHGLLNGRALHSAAVHAEHWKGQTEAPFTVTFTGILKPKKKHWLLTVFAVSLLPRNPVFALAFLFHSKLEKCNMPQVFCAREAGDKIFKS